MDKQKVAALVEQLRIVPHKSLILLYVLDKVKIALPMERINYITSLNGWMDYFDMVDALTTMAESELVLLSTEESGGPYFSLSEEGAEALNLFRTRLPASLREEMDTFMNENEAAISLTARHRSHLRHDENGWKAVLATDGTELVLRVPTHGVGMKVCDTWTEQADEIAEQILERLTK